MVPGAGGGAFDSAGLGAAEGGAFDSAGLGAAGGGAFDGGGLDGGGLDGGGLDGGGLGDAGGGGLDVAGLGAAGGGAFDSAGLGAAGGGGLGDAGGGGLDGGGLGDASGGGLDVAGLGAAAGDGLDEQPHSCRSQNKRDSQRVRGNTQHIGKGMIHRFIHIDSKCRDVSPSSWDDIIDIDVYSTRPVADGHFSFHPYGDGTIPSRTSHQTKYLVVKMRLGNTSFSNEIRSLKKASFFEASFISDL